MAGLVGRADAAEYVLDMFGASRSSGKMGDLVKFHTRNKYLIMAHDPAGLGALGRVVANCEGRPAGEAFGKYGELLGNVLEHDATVSKHANAVMRMYGHFLQKMDERSSALLDTVNRYRRDDITLGCLLEAVSDAVYHLDEAYLASQTYFLLYCNTHGGTASMADALPGRTRGYTSTYMPSSLACTGYVSSFTSFR